MSATLTQSKLSATREGNRIATIFALRTQMHDHPMYSDLQAVRHEVFTSLCDGGEYNFERVAECRFSG